MRSCFADSAVETVEAADKVAVVVGTVAVGAGLRSFGVVGFEEGMVQGEVAVEPDIGLAAVGLVLAVVVGIVQVADN